MEAVMCLHDRKINFKAKIFFSQLPFQEEELDLAMYGLIEQRGFSEDAAYHETYDDGKNQIGIFAATENQTSQQRFNEWFHGHNSSLLKTSVIGEVIALYYLHHNILRARRGGFTDLSEHMRKGLFFPSIIGNLTLQIKFFTHFFT